MAGAATGHRFYTLLSLVGASTVTEVVAIAALTEYAARKLSEPEPDTECPPSRIRLLFAISAILFIVLYIVYEILIIFLARKIIIIRIIDLLFFG